VADACSFETERIRRQPGGGVATEALPWAVPEAHEKTEAHGEVSAAALLALYVNGRDASI
jgi:hypothetical protein